MIPEWKAELHIRNRRERAALFVEYVCHGKVPSSKEDFIEMLMTYAEKADDVTERMERILDDHMLSCNRPLIIRL